VVGEGEAEQVRAVVESAGRDGSSPEACAVQAVRLAVRPCDVMPRAGGRDDSVGGDGTVRVWDWRAPRTPPTIVRTLQGYINGIAFAGDGRHLASAGGDGTVRVWDCQRCGDIKDVLKVARARMPREITPG